MLLLLQKNNNPLEEKQKQPIWEKTTTTHWDFQGFLSFFLRSWDPEQGFEAS
jgi:hypothetical protein